jgi:hypothetical protein
MFADALDQITYPLHRWESLRFVIYGYLVRKKVEEAVRVYREEAVPNLFTKHLEPRRERTAGGAGASSSVTTGRARRGAAASEGAAGDDAAPVLAPAAAGARTVNAEFARDYEAIFQKEFGEEGELIRKMRPEEVSRLVVTHFHFFATGLIQQDCTRNSAPGCLTAELCNYLLI